MLSFFDLSLILLNLTLSIVSFFISVNTFLLTLDYLSIIMQNKRIKAFIILIKVLKWEISKKLSLGFLIYIGNFLIFYFITVKLTELFGITSNFVGRKSAIISLASLTLFFWLFLLGETSHKRSSLIQLKSAVRSDIEKLETASGNTGETDVILKIFLKLCFIAGLYIGFFTILVMQLTVN